MSKRGRDTLTGGTGDVSPQLFALGNVTLSAANTSTQETIPVPVQRYTASGNKALVMEVLKVYFTMADADANNAAGGSVLQSLAHLSTRATAGPANSATFATCQKAYRGAFTAAGTYQAIDTDPVIIDLTDGAGHGVLVATDNIFFTCSTVGYTAAGTFEAKLLYRFKEVSLAEYIGIVQSQQ